jgi:hypothetical protein
MYCPGCGKEVQGNPKYCPECGQATKPETETTGEYSPEPISIALGVGIIAFLYAFPVVPAEHVLLGMRTLTISAANGACTSATYSCPPEISILFILGGVIGVLLLATGILHKK